MGSSDIPPASAPAWLIPASTLCLSAGVGLWLACYVLMARRAARTLATPMPLLALGLNLAWEVVFAAYVTEMPIERVGFVLWLLFDLPLLRATVAHARHSFADAPLIARHVKGILALIFVAGLAGNYAFAAWWLAEPHRGHGRKDGKPWRGREGRDTTELAWWSAGVAQMVLSVSCVAMLLSRGHSGGQSYGIWLCRFAGSLMGLPVTCGLLWWYWPEPHGFIFHPLSYIIMVPTFACDIAYPFLLAHVRRTEKVLPNGMVVAGGGDETKKRQ
ncbi:hypothetical protein ISF_05038 [Cordyceps fumosorosea ARSEF 2679]|uniref:PaxB protein n=1 Tax=Cordyceps fumosorosea (strain ARSEF 2679) TaxID=1081104 RepID=A0A162J397_CORFA|nr:hypothetical protein ISF_05038 [Cordyceps fumosorosea ARSEF 2679]OAA63162.1 hypothetical protein ISF_05038 [Cordyceps fumosorosea ARSEF 2679]